MGQSTAKRLVARAPIRRFRRAKLRILLMICALSALAVGCNPVGGVVLIGPVSVAGGVASFEVVLGGGADLTDLSVSLDDHPVGVEAVGANRVRVQREVVPGFHVVVASVGDLSSVAPGPPPPLDVEIFRAPAAAPDLVASTPEDASADLLRTAWLVLDFADALPGSTQSSFALDCDGEPVALAASFPDATPHRVVLNPAPEMPASAACVLAWQGRDGSETISFATAGRGAALEAIYDRADAGATTPFPDDYWTLDPATCEAAGFAIPIPDREADVVSLYSALVPEANALDGFSPLAALVVEFSDAVDPTSLPATPAESMDPLAAAGLFDIDPTSLYYGERIPFQMQVRDDITGVSSLRAFSAMVFPSRPLDPGGTYALVLTRRAHASPERPLEPSASMAAALAPEQAGEDTAITCVRSLLRPVLDVVETATAPPIPREDIAVALRFSIRSLEPLATEYLALREAIQAAPAPAFRIDDIEEVADPNSGVAAIVTGTWDAPEFRGGGTCAAPGANFERDAAGVPMLAGTCPIAFTLALPLAALEAPVPVLLYQHGNPGSSEEEVPRQARRGLAAAGFAVIGFTDVLNRELSGNTDDSETAITRQVVATISALLSNQRLPDYWAQTNAEQMGMLRLIEELATARILPSDDPMAEPELDLGRPLTYLGISQGANHAPGLLAYAPEVRAAALVAGGARVAEVLIHQQSDAFLNLLPFLFGSLNPAEIWAGLSLFQTVFDRQDAHNHARFWMREPVEVEGSLAKASVLLVEGINDSLVPNHASESLAWQLQAPQAEPVAVDVPFLEKTTYPVEANLDPDTSAAFVQFVPIGLPELPASPGCIPPAVSQTTAVEGHYCAQSAAEARAQRLQFFLSSLDGATPVVDDPFASLPN